MVRRLALLLLLVVMASGCGLWNIGNRGEPGYTLDPDKIGSGQPAIVPRNDAGYVNGESMDHRTHR